MKRMLTLCLLVLVFLALLTAPASSVELKKSRPASAIGHGDLSVSIRLIGGKGSVLKPGRDIRLTFQTDRDAYVVVYNIDSDGYVNLLYPEDGNLKKTRGREVHYLPEEGSGIYWEAGGKTGIEYIHTLAVSDRDLLKEDEIYFLSQSGNLDDEKRFRVDMDPFMSFNMIDEELLVDTDVPLATDFTYFYVNRRVDYPRFLCAKCHGHDEFRDPYSKECPEIVIEKATYEEDLTYPYPELFAIRDVDEDYYISSKYADKQTEDWDEYDEDQTKVYLSIYYSDWDYPYWYSGPYFRYHFATYLDPFWWDFGWSWYWSDYYYYHWPFYSWYYPYYYHWHGWWRHYDYCCYDRWYGYKHRPIYARRRTARRNLSYTAAALRRNKTRTLAQSRLVKRRLDTARRLERTSLKRTGIGSRIADRISRGTGARRSTTRDRRSTIRTRDVQRKIIYGNERKQRYKDADKARRERKDRSSRLRDRIDRSKGSGDSKSIKDRRDTRKQRSDKSINRKRSSDSSKKRSSSRPKSTIRKKSSSPKRIAPRRAPSPRSRSGKKSSKPSRSSGSRKRTVSRSTPRSSPARPARSASRSSSRSSGSSGRSGRSRKR
ncbi:MAG: DUF4384 domain-containing protein [bacterium]|nr:MAG: DUF4384 domain-containing protein [bacterium]